MSRPFVWSRVSLVILGANAEYKAQDRAANVRLLLGARDAK
jgi:hypothetical protein